MREELLKGLTEEQIKKVDNCKSTKELLDLAKAEGVELSDEQLEAVSGGGCFTRKAPTVKCPTCGEKNCEKYEKSGGYYKWRCNSCGAEWQFGAKR